MEIPIAVALIGGTFGLVGTAGGWLANHVFTSRRDEQRRKTEGLLEYTSQQLELLYGPLAFLVFEGREAFSSLLKSVKPKPLFKDADNPSKDELIIWFFWIEHDFFPRNARIQELLSKYSHLIDGSEFPSSYSAFVNHHNSWTMKHRRWTQHGVEYSWFADQRWPSQFEYDVLDTFARLKARQARLLGELAE
jgi:hypothetical protein